MVRLALVLTFPLMLATAAASITRKQGGLAQPSLRTPYQHLLRYLSGETESESQENHVTLERQHSPHPPPFFRSHSHPPLHRRRPRTPQVPPFSPSRRPPHFPPRPQPWPRPQVPQVRSHNRSPQGRPPFNVPSKNLRTPRFRPFPETRPQFQGRPQSHGRPPPPPEQSTPPEERPAPFHGRPTQKPPSQLQERQPPPHPPQERPPPPQQRPPALRPRPSLQNGHAESQEQLPPPQNAPPATLHLQVASPLQNLTPPLPTIHSSPPRQRPPSDVRPPLQTKPPSVRNPRHGPSSLNSLPGTTLFRDSREEENQEAQVKRERELHRQLQEQLLPQLRQQPPPSFLNPSHPDISIIPLQGHNDILREQFPPYHRFPPFTRTSRNPSPFPPATHPPSPLTPSPAAPLPHFPTGSHTPPLPLPPHPSPTDKHSPPSHPSPTGSHSPSLSLPPHPSFTGNHSPSSHPSPTISHSPPLPLPSRSTPPGLPVPRPSNPFPPQSVTTPSPPAAFSPPGGHLLPTTPAPRSPTLHVTSLTPSSSQGALRVIPSPQLLPRPTPNPPFHSPGHSAPPPQLSPNSRTHREFRGTGGNAQLFFHRFSGADGRDPKLEGGGVLSGSGQPHQPTSFPGPPFNWGRQKSNSPSQPSRHPRSRRSVVVGREPDAAQPQVATRGQGGGSRGVKKDRQHGRGRRQRPGVVEFLRQHLVKAGIVSDDGVGEAQEARRVVEARLRRLVGGTARRAAIVGQVAGELLGAGVVAAGEAGSAIAEALLNEEGPNYVRDPPTSHTYSGGLQLTVPHPSHVTRHRLGLRFHVAPNPYGRLIPPMGLGFDSQVVKRPVPDGKAPPPAFLEPYTDSIITNHPPPPPPPPSPPLPLSPPLPPPLPHNPPQRPYYRNNIMPHVGIKECSTNKECELIFSTLGHNNYSLLVYPPPYNHKGPRNNSPFTHYHQKPDPNHPRVHPQNKHPRSNDVRPSHRNHNHHHNPPNHKHKTLNNHLKNHNPNLNYHHNTLNHRNKHGDLSNHFKNHNPSLNHPRSLPNQNTKHRNLNNHLKTHSSTSDYPHNIDEIKAILEDPSYPGDYYSEAFKPKHTDIIDLSPKPNIELVDLDLTLESYIPPKLDPDSNLPFTSFLDSTLKPFSGLSMNSSASPEPSSELDVKSLETYQNQAAHPETLSDSNTSFKSHLSSSASLPHLSSSTHLPSSASLSDGHTSLPTSNTHFAFPHFSASNQNEPNSHPGTPSTKHPSLPSHPHDIPLVFHVRFTFPHHPHSHTHSPPSDLPSSLSNSQVPPSIHYFLHADLHPTPLSESSTPLSGTPSPFSRSRNPVSDSHSSVTYPHSFLTDIQSSPSDTLSSLTDSHSTLTDSHSPLTDSHSPLTDSHSPLTDSSFSSPILLPGGISIESLLSPYSTEEELRAAIMEKEEEFYVMNAISNPYEHFDEVLVLEDEGVRQLRGEV